MIGYFTIAELLGDDDKAGAKVMARVKAVPDNGLEAFLYLPPYLRTSQCGIGNGARVFGIVDDVSGLGAALFGAGDADFGYFVDADVEIKKGLKVADDIETASGDVKAGAVTLKTHTHPITIATFTGTIDPTTGAATGTVTGNTDAPSGA